jgi:hypothetical protein
MLREYIIVSKYWKLNLTTLQPHPDGKLKVRIRKIKGITKKTRRNVKRKTKIRANRNGKIERIRIRVIKIVKIKRGRNQIIVGKTKTGRGRISIIATNIKY